MFDRAVILHQPRVTEHVTHTHVEKRAPTDESVRLLKEMEEKAEAKILESIAVTGNGFEGVAHRMSDFMSGREIWRMVFSLNGKRLAAEHSFVPTDRRELGRQMEAFRDAIAKEIATHILTRSIPELVRA